VSETVGPTNRKGGGKVFIYIGDEEDSDKSLVTEQERQIFLLDVQSSGLIEYRETRLELLSWLSSIAE
jgi:hypothetical protein